MGGRGGGGGEVLDSSQPCPDQRQISLFFPLPHTLSRCSAWIPPLSPPQPQNLRERLGVHTCDIRPPSYELETVYGRIRNARNPLDFVLEPGLTAADELWSPTERETDASMDRRARALLSELFADHDEPRTRPSYFHSSRPRAIVRRRSGRDFSLAARLTGAPHAFGGLHFRRRSRRPRRHHDGPLPRDLAQGAPACLPVCLVFGTRVLTSRCLTIPRGNLRRALRQRAVRTHSPPPTHPPPPPLFRFPHAFVMALAFSR